MESERAPRWYFRGRAVDSRPVERGVTLVQLERVFSERVRPAFKLALVAFVLGAVVAAGLLGRGGTVPFRLGAAALLVLLGLALLVRKVRARRARARRDLMVRRLVLAADRALGERVLRAFSLEDRAETDPTVGSLELARLHAVRSVGRIPRSLVAARGDRLASRLRIAAVVVGLAGTVGLALDPVRVIEGLDVLIARRGLAPIPMVFLEGLSVLVQSPGYLRMSDRHADPTMSRAPVGSTLVVRGLPVRPGRTLVLTDGAAEVPFSSEGGDGLVARWVVKQDAELWVAARFGDVVVREPQPIRIEAVPDGAPVVVLEGAPREVQLEGLERLELGYFASDDHGLRQIDLVLRSGGREDRRVLERLDGQSRTERGAQALDPGDAFVRRSFLPVFVTIEAKDNDVLTGAKWGRSAPITIQPPALGAPEARRFEALLAARGSVLDVLGWLGSEAPRPVPARALAERRKGAAASLRDVGSRLTGTARISDGFAAFLDGQARRLETVERGREPADTIGDVALAVDAGLRALAKRDAEGVAKRLGDVAEEAANAFADARVTERARASNERSAAALSVLDAGQRNLASLGALGADLGSVTRGELARIRRALDARSLYHAELAARHLAARLRRPQPSFSSAGSGGGGVEGGSQQGQADPDAPPSEADRRFDELVGELSKLTREHAALLEQVERDLSEAAEAVGNEDLKKQAAEKATALREALEGLPRAGAPEGSGRASAALAREHGAAMAERLERLELGGALESGRTARGLSDDAKHKTENPRSIADLTDQGALGRARSSLADAIAWAEQAEQRLRRDADAQVRPRLGEASERERSIERRIGEVAGRGERGEARLPEPVLDRLRRAREAMRSAASELAEGRGEQGLLGQREAQRLLEEGSSGRTTDESTGPESPGQSGGDGKDGRSVGGRESVPKADDKLRARDFRRRVLEGLGKERGSRLDPAIRRYAEGLLQ
jgi:hypothetical protein